METDASGELPMGWVKATQQDVRGRCWEGLMSVIYGCVTENPTHPTKTEVHVSQGLLS